MAYPPNSPTPTFAGFQLWVTNVVGIPSTAIPATPPFEQWAYDTAVALVNLQLQGVPGPLYLQAVYNLATDTLINWCVDVPGVYYPTNNPNQLGWFAYLRKQFNISGFTAGVVQASYDQGSSTNLAAVSYTHLTLPTILRV